MFMMKLGNNLMLVVVVVVDVCGMTVLRNSMMMLDAGQITR